MNRGATRQRGGKPRDERRQHRASQQQTESSTCQDDGEAFGDELLHEPDGARTQRRAHREFRLPSNRLRQLKVHDVRDGDEQHERDGAENGEQRRTGVAHHVVLERFEKEAGARILLGKRADELRRDLIQFGERALERHAVAHAGDGGQVATGPARPRERRGVSERHEDLRVRVDDVVVLGRQHADDGTRLAAERNRATDDRRIGVEASLPELVAENDDGVLIGNVFVPHEITAERHRHAERAEVVPCDARALEALGILRRRERRLPRADGGDGGEGRGAGAHVLDRAVARREWLPSLPRPKEREPFRVRVRQRLEEQGVDHTEDRGRRSDGERQGDDANDRERRRATENADAVAQISKEVAHGIRSLPSGERELSKMPHRQSRFAPEARCAAA